MSDDGMSDEVISTSDHVPNEVMIFDVCRKLRHVSESNMGPSDVLGYVKDLERFSCIQQLLGEKYLVVQQFKRQVEGPVKLAIDQWFRSNMSNLAAVVYGIVKSLLATIVKNIDGYMRLHN